MWNNVGCGTYDVEISQNIEKKDSLAHYYRHLD